MFRPVVKAVYLSWLLLLPKLIGRFCCTPIADWATIFFILLMVVFFAMQRYLVRGLLAGSVK